MKSIFAVILLIGLRSYAASYFIDNDSGSDAADGLSTNTPWQRCPGMVGFSGAYAHSAGDQFNLKGGVTWTNALVIANSGAAGFENYDTYKTHPSWFSGAQWSRAMIDQEGTGYGIFCQSQSFIRFDGLHVTNCGTADRGISFSYGQGFISTNCWISSGAANGLEIAVVATESTNFWVRNCRFWHNPNQLYLFSGTNSVAADWRIEDNEFLGNDVDPGGLHPDGVQFGGYGPDSVIPHARGLYSFTNVVIARNRFSGDWPYGGTAMTFFGEGVGGAKIYGNQFAFDNTTDFAANYLFSPGFLYLFRSSDILIYNNTFSSDANYALNKGARDGLVIGVGCTNLVIKNNIFSRVENCINCASVNETNSLVIDHNLYFPRAPGYSIWLPGWRSTNMVTLRSFGYETNGLYGSPGFVATGNYSLASTSPAVGAGEDLGSEFSMDCLGQTRVAPWDIGAYEYFPSGGIAATANTVNVGTLNVGQ